MIKCDQFCRICIKMRIKKLSIPDIKIFKNNLASFLHAQSTKISPVKILVSEQINKLNTVYMKVIRLDELKLSQDKVNVYQERLLETQTNRRDISIQLTNVRHESNGLHNQISEAKRTENDDRYIELVRLERELKRKETTITDQLQHVDKLERDLFTALTNAIRDSHVTQRAQAEYTKYFSIILSIFGSFASFLFFMVRKEELKEFIVRQIEVLDANTKERDRDLSESVFEMTELQRIYLQKLAMTKEISDANQNRPKSDFYQFSQSIAGKINTSSNEYSPIFKYCGIALSALLLFNIFRT